MGGCGQGEWRKGWRRSEGGGGLPKAHDRMARRSIRRRGVMKYSIARLSVLLGSMSECLVSKELEGCVGRGVEGGWGGAGFSREGARVPTERARTGDIISFC